MPYPTLVWTELTYPWGHMNPLQIERTSKLIVASLIASLAIVACNDSGGLVEPVDELAPKLVQESAAQWRLDDGKEGATIALDGDRVRIVAGQRTVELSAETSALFTRVLSTIAKGDSLVARQAGSGRYIRQASNQAQLEKARKNIAAHRARQQSANGFAIASIDESDICQDIGLALYDATGYWRSQRDHIGLEIASIAFFSALDYLWNQSVPGLAALEALGLLQTEFTATTLSMEFLQIEFGLSHCFGPYQ